MHHNASLLSGENKRDLLDCSSVTQSVRLDVLGPVKPIKRGKGKNLLACKSEGEEKRKNNYVNYIFYSSSFYDVRRVEFGNMTGIFLEDASRVKIRCA